ncbi:MAG: hypothetical protein M1490_02185 [Candidatus Bathyarchaeota archaeon]|nr:hypothetical protein [Candidatus Bathyarchaeota archaeon]
MTASLKKRTKPSVFQVLLLDNDESEDVEVQEAKQVDFCQVKEHLKNGGSVFITSKGSQKLSFPKAKAQQNYSKSRRTYGFLFRQHMRSP